MNIFLSQEIDRMQKVITKVRNSLNDLKLAIEGTIVMSEASKAYLLLMEYCILKYYFDCFSSYIIIPSEFECCT